ncbi:MAG: hypothetical protein IJ228_03570 [Succinivibrio sp.]|nr:hypothetical protein [Succinivibrio sp.]
MRSELFERLSIPKLMAHCVLPGTVSMVASSLYIVVDGMFVGHYMGHDSLAAANLMWPLLGILFAIADMIAYGSSVQISMFLGRRSRLSASRTFSFCVWVLFGFSAVAGLLGYFLTEPFLMLVGAGEDTARLGKEYIISYCVSAPLVMLFFATDSYLRVCGRQKFSMWLRVFTSLFNLLLDYIFIVLLRQGIWSASFTTCVTLSLGTLIAFYPFLRRRMDVEFVRGRIRFKQFTRLCYNGVTELLQSVSGSVFMLVANTMMLSLGGTVAVAAHAAVLYIDSVAIRVLMGTVNSLQPALSYCYGAALYARVAAVEKWLLSLCALLFLLTAGPLIIPYYAADGDEEFIIMGRRCIVIFAFTYLTGWVEICLHGFLTALDSPSRAFVLSLCRALLLPLPLLLLLKHCYGLDGVWSTHAVTCAVAALLSVALTLPFWRNKISSRLPLPS